MALTRVKISNFVDQGTEGTKIALGTTAQRGTTQGQIRFNTTTGLAEYYTGTAMKVIDTPPTVTSIDISEVDSQAGGNQTVVITGTNFASGATASFVGTSASFDASTTTVDSSTQITAVAPKSSFLSAQEPYAVKVSNASGLSGEKTGLINVDTAPSWSTAAGNIGAGTIEGIAASISTSATDPDSDTITYSVQSGSLPGGLSLNTSSGAITGTPSAVSSDTTSNFTLRATAGSKTADRAFNIVVLNDTVTDHASSNWSELSTGVSGLRAENTGRAITSSSSGSTGYLYAISSENESAQSGYAWLTSDNNAGSNYWRGNGTGSAQAGDNLEMWFAGREVTITNLKIYSYPSGSYEFDTVQLQYWNGSDWIKVVGIGGYSGASSGWSWSKSGGSNSVNTIAYSGSSHSSFKSTNWRINYGGNVHTGSDDVVHQNGASNLSFKILG